MFGGADFILTRQAETAFLAEPLLRGGQDAARAGAHRNVAKILTKA